MRRNSDVYQGHVMDTSDIPGGRAEIPNVLRDMTSKDRDGKAFSRSDKIFTKGFTECLSVLSAWRTRVRTRSVEGTLFMITALMIEDVLK
jgi:hypothetical protein